MLTLRNCIVPILFAALLCAGLSSTHAAGVEGREGDIRPTGMRPVFPAGTSCTEIASAFGSPERYDGSARRAERFSGLHGGMDLSLQEGTPLLAVAAGRVIAKGEGGNLEGIYLWLQHAPADTGLAYWAYTKYQHLSRLPQLAEGEQVTTGQVVGHSGLTGTIGRAFGPAGYPHLHLTLFAGPSGEFQKAGQYGSMVRASGARIVDPMLLYAPDADPLQDVPVVTGATRVAAVVSDGRRIPDGAKIVWPVYCTATGAN